MPRYIDADKLKETITDNFLNPYERNHIHDLIDIQPIADVQEVKHGKYIGEQQYGDCVMQHCEQCGYLVYVDDYCGHCGAKMDLK